MIRTQVQITEQQDKLLEDIGRERRLSKSELIRRAVDMMLECEGIERSLEEQRERALALSGRFRSGGTDTARRHDEALADAYSGGR
ncbi:hypothetical protein BH23ACT11_BH23ACT11_28660 [soil metagenome]